LRSGSREFFHTARKTPKIGYLFAFLGKNDEGSLTPTLQTLDLVREEKAPARFRVTFTGDEQAFVLTRTSWPPTPRRWCAKVGSYPHGRIVNATKERQPMRNHPLPFLAHAQNNRPTEDPLWPDTVNVAYGESADSSWITDPVIKGMSVFHCRLLTQQDKGVMAKILFEGKCPETRVSKLRTLQGRGKQGHANK